MAQISHDKGSDLASKLKAKWSFSHKIVAILTLATVIYAVFLAYSIASTAGAQAVVDTQMKEVEAEMQKLEADQIEHLMIASQAVEKINTVDVKWSEVLTLLLDATPDDLVYRSYSGNENGTVTTSVLAQSFNRVADLINILDNKPFVKNVFVPSVVKGTSPTNAAVYSFALNVEFEK